MQTIRGEKPSQGSGVTWCERLGVCHDERDRLSPQSPAQLGQMGTCALEFLDVSRGELVAIHRMVARPTS